MTPLGFAFDPGAVPSGALWLSLLLAAGAYLVVTSQPLAQPKPDLGERLRRLDVDERIKMALAHRESPPIFASPLLEGLLRPILEDAGRLARALAARLGPGGGEELERKLRIARPGVGVVQFYGDKVLTGVLGFAFFPLMNALGAAPFGPWPLWTWAAGFALGFAAPDLQLERAVAARRTACLMELPTVLDMLTIATSAGLGVEQALAEVANQSSGVVGEELRLAGREMALGQRTMVEALEAMAARNGVPELSRFAAQLRAAHEQGIPLVDALSTQADALREQKRLKIVEAGGKATVRMVVPIGLFVFPTLFVVLLVPAVVQVLNLGG